MKALVTGANGFVGSSIVRALLGDGAEVKALIRQNSDIRNLEGLDVEKCYGDVRDGESVKKALKGCDTLFHTAAIYSFWLPDSKDFYDVNVEGTKTVLGAALELGVEKCVYTSSIIAVGFYGKDKPANEDVEYNLWDTGDHYSRSKHLAEIEAHKFAEKGLPVVIVNPAEVLGVRDIKPTPSGQMIIDIVTRRMPGYIDGGLNFVDVEDVARGHILAAQKGKAGSRYILGNENISVGDYYKLVGEVAGVKPPSIKFPASMAVMLGYLYQFASGFTKKPPVLTAPMVRLGSKYAFFDCSKAVNELGMPQTPIRKTVEKALGWFRENGYLKR
jgi:dihydroflavonol-4-reductase